MRPLMLLTLAGLLMAGAGMAVGQPSSAPQTVAGEWQVTWIPTNRNPQNALVLTTSGSAVQGVYTNDGGQSCAVSGSTSIAESWVGLHIACPAFTVDMVGHISPDGRTITGNETGTGVAPSKFIMRKQ